MSAKWWLLPMAFLLLPACAPAASTAQPAADPTPSAAPPAATATPAATPDPTATPTFDSNTLDYDEIRRCVKVSPARWQKAISLLAKMTSGG